MSKMWLSLPQALWGREPVRVSGQTGCHFRGFDLSPIAEPFRVISSEINLSEVRGESWTEFL